MSQTLPLPLPISISRRESAWQSAACQFGVVALRERIPLTHGGVLENARVAYQLAGPEGAPVVCVLGGISAGRHVVFDDQARANGWWAEHSGPGRALDTSRVRVLSIDFLGGNGESTGPRTGTTLPHIDTHDQARAIAGVLRPLGIGRLAAIIGSSYGGMVALAFGELYPELVQRLVVISAADRPHPRSTALRAIQRRIVAGAIADGRPADGLRLARALAMVTYRSADEFEQRFSGLPCVTSGRFRFPVEEYLDARGDDFAAGFHPQAYLALSQSIDLHQVDPEGITVPVTLVSVASDELVPASTMRRLAAQLRGPAQLVEIDSPFGHDAFLKETDTIDSILADALQEI